MKQERFDLIKLSIETPTIVITDRGHDYMAVLEDTPGVWGRGETPSNAIGDLILSHKEVFNVKIEFPKKS